MFEDLIPEFQGPARELLEAAGSARLMPRITSTRRTRAQQERLYRRWQSGLSPFPAAPPGLSAHEYGYAFDMTVSPFEALADVGYTWESWGGVWGSTKDPVHFEYPGFSPPIDVSRDVPSYIQLCHFLSGFTALGPLQLADAIAEHIAPLHSSPESMERKIQAFIHGPCSALYNR